ncbi:MAG TPA: hypothetical protein VMR06_12680 [Dokdonella sp.]|uniref:hypothetical protein n=1 Tax=Dokdonella sp. TaxID=2291710 RepID=UPI002B602C6D|nr:hypothetical protein [Dokdonella sp.]HUD42838.1 hypothetical protein [Dokdonella sp.]
MHALERRYGREMALAAVLYVAAMLTAWPLALRTDAASLRAVLALLPVLPAALMLRAIYRHVRDSDELQRRLHLEALAISASAVSLVSMALGFLAAAKVIVLGGDVLLWVFPVLAGVFGVVRCWIQWRYRCS